MGGVHCRHTRQAISWLTACPCHGTLAARERYIGAKKSKSRQPAAAVRARTQARIHQRVTPSCAVRRTTRRPAHMSLADRIACLRQTIADARSEMRHLQKQDRDRRSTELYIVEWTRVKRALELVSERETKLRAQAALAMAWQGTLTGDGDDGRRVFCPAKDMIVSLCVGHEAFTDGCIEPAPGVVMDKLTVTCSVTGTHEETPEEGDRHITPGRVVQGTVCVSTSPHMRCGGWSSIAKHVQRFVAHDNQSAYIHLLCESHPEWYRPSQWTGEGVYTVVANVTVFVRRGIIDDECLLPVLFSPDA